MYTGLSQFTKLSLRKIDPNLTHCTVLQSHYQAFNVLHVSRVIYKYALHYNPKLILKLSHDSLQKYIKRENIYRVEIIVEHHKSFTVFHVPQRVGKIVFSDFYNSCCKRNSVILSVMLNVDWSTQNFQLLCLSG